MINLFKTCNKCNQVFKESVWYLNSQQISVRNNHFFFLQFFFSTNWLGKQQTSLTSDLIHCFGTNLNLIYGHEKLKQINIYQFVRYIWPCNDMNFLDQHSLLMQKLKCISEILKSNGCCEQWIFILSNNLMVLKFMFYLLLKKIDISCRKVLNKTHF